MRPQFKPHVRRNVIGHYNLSVRIIDLVSHITYVLCVNFIHKWRNLQFKVDLERHFLRNFSWEFYLLSRVFDRNLLRANLRINNFCISFWCLAWDLNPGFSSTTPIHYLNVKKCKCKQIIATTSSKQISDTKAESKIKQAWHRFQSEWFWFRICNYDRFAFLFFRFRTILFIPKIYKIAAFQINYGNLVHNKQKTEHNWWIKRITKRKEQKGAGTKILIEIKKNLRFYMKNIPLPPTKNINY